MLVPLDGRKIRILQAIVNDYVSTTRPVGSERLIEIYKLGCKSATVRNEMAEMSEMGYLTQPYTSAGRIPTDQGYRYYVDALMDPEHALTAEEERISRERHRSSQAEIDELIILTCRLLSELTSYPSMATDPIADSTFLRHVYLAGATEQHVLVVMLFSTGRVEHRLLKLDPAPDESALTRVANYITARFTDRPLQEIVWRIDPDVLPIEIAPYENLARRIVDVIETAAAGVLERKVFLEGANQFLRQPEFQDVQRLENLLNALEERQSLHSVLSRALSSCGVSITIGAENDFEPMQGCSFIATSYYIGARHSGYLGVIGPTRMNYDRATAAVGLMAQSLSQMLTNLSLA